MQLTFKQKINKLMSLEDWKILTSSWCQTSSPHLQKIQN